jgi:hypothetical protein
MKVSEVLYKNAGNPYFTSIRREGVEPSSKWNDCRMELVGEIARRDRMRKMTLSSFQKIHLAIA